MNKVTIEGLKKLKKNEIEYQKELEKVENKLVKELCPKGYKTKCDPAYCSFAHTDSCPFLKE